MKYALFLMVMFAVFLSALQIVIAQHNSRKFFVEIQSLEETRDKLNEEWTRLLLEQSTWATDSRIESVSRSELDMTVPDINTRVVVIE